MPERLAVPRCPGAGDLRRRRPALGSGVGAPVRRGAGRAGRAAARRRAPAHVRGARATGELLLGFTDAAARAVPDIDWSRAVGRDTTDLGVGRTSPSPRRVRAAAGDQHGRVPPACPGARGHRHGRAPIRHRVVDLGEEEASSTTSAAGASAAASSSGSCPATSGSGRGGASACRSGWTRPSRPRCSARRPSSAGRWYPSRMSGAATPGEPRTGCAPPRRGTNGSRSRRTCSAGGWAPARPVDAGGRLHLAADARQPGAGAGRRPGRRGRLEPQAPVVPLPVPARHHAQTRRPAGALRPRRPPSRGGSRRRRRRRRERLRRPVPPPPRGQGVRRTHTHRRGRRAVARDRRRRVACYTANLTRRRSGHDTRAAGCPARRLIWLGTEPKTLGWRIRPWVSQNRCKSGEKNHAGS